MRMALAALLLTLAALLLAVTATTRASGETAPEVYLPLVSCPGCTGGTSAPTPSPTPRPDVPGAIDQMVELVNQARLAAGCPAALPNAILMRAAQDWSDYVARTFDYRHAPSNWYTNPPYFYPTNSVWENMAVGETPDYAFEGWMGSTLHRRNIELCYKPDDPSYSPNINYDIGVGFAGGYWTLAIGIYNP